MIGHREECRQKLNSQTLMTRQGTGEVRGGRTQRRRNTIRHGETNIHKRKRKTWKNTGTLKGHKRVWKSKHKTPKDMRHRKHEA